MQGNCQRTSSIINRPRADDEQERAGGCGRVQLFWVLWQFPVQVFSGMGMGTRVGLWRYTHNQNYNSSHRDPNKCGMPCAHGISVEASKRGISLVKVAHKRGN